MPTHFEEVIKFHKGIKKDYTHALQALEEKIISGRDEKDVPLYITKWRVKTAESIFLKVKRKNYEKLENIDDMGGMRILCLFNQDVSKVYDFLLDDAFANLDITELKIYDDVKVARSYANHKSLANYPTLNKPKIFSKESGYKSIHFKISYPQGGNKCFIELQLRTLLQDVWGELEHALAYKKGMPNSQIKRYFLWLQRDLENISGMLAQLKEISQKDKLINDFSKLDVGPYSFLSYENELYPKEFSAKSVRVAIEKYQAHWRNKAGAKSTKQELVRDGARLFREFLDARTDSGQTVEQLSATNKNAKYWIEMENAYCSFVDNNIPDAIDKYETILLAYEKQYVPHFRLGELYFIQGNLIKSLKSFDMAETLLIKHEKQKNEKQIAENKYRIKVKLANIYWALGPEYNNVTLTLIDEAAIIFNELESPNEQDRESLANNVCWYKLEKYLIESE